MARRIRLSAVLVAVMTLAPGLGVGAVEAPEPAEATVEVLVATPWQVRRDARLLLDQLRHGERAGSLVDRSAALLAAHATALVEDGDGWRPLGAVLTAALREAGLLDEYQRLVERQANEALRQAHGDTAALQALIARFPGSAAATRAWQQLANRHWDRGRLGAFLLATSQLSKLGETTSPERIAAAQQLLVTSPLHLPQTLAGLSRMWALADLPAATAPTQPTRQRRHRHEHHEQVPARVRFAQAVDGSAVALSDGQFLYVIDPLFGTVLGERHVLGSAPGGFDASPLSDRHGFIAMGLSRHARPVLLAVDARGRQLWRSEAATSGRIASPPILLHDLVVFATLERARDGEELSLSALHRHDGSLAWQTLVAKDPRGAARGFHGHAQLTASQPMLAEVAGQAVVGSNGGLIAAVAADGSLRRVWTYDSDRLVPELMERSAQRRGTILGRGTSVVAAPADAEGLLVIDLVDEQMRRYRGAGSRDQLMALQGHQALLAGRRLTLVDLAELASVWSLPVASTAADEVWAQLDDKRVLARIDAQLLLVDRSQGQIIDAAGLLVEESLDLAGEMLLTVSPHPDDPELGRMLVAYGNAHSRERLEDLARQEPNNPRPIIALASLERAAGRRAKAFDLLLRALALGADPALAEEARLLARQLIQRRLGGEEAADALTRFDHLTTINTDIAAEAAWWRGRDHELRRQLDQAAKAYAACLAQPSTLLELEQGLSVDLHALAELALHRLQRADLPDWATRPVEASRPLRPAQDWRSEQRFLGEPLLASDLLLGYAGGRITAFAAHDGSQRWRAQPAPDELPLLGVRSVPTRALPDIPGGGMRVELVAGSAAEAAGLHDGDLLRSYDGQELVEFSQLAAQVSSKRPGDPFRLKLLRDGQELTVTGSLGARLSQAIDADERAILVQPMALAGGHREMRLVPDTFRDPMLSAFDRADGRLLWRRALSTDSLEDGGIRPQLLGGGLALLYEEGAVVAVDGPGEARWRLVSERPDGARLAVPLGRGLLALPGPGRQQLRLVDAASGRERFRLPGSLEQPPLLSGQTLLASGEHGRLACWDLGLGTRLWQSPQRDWRALASAGDNVICLDHHRRLVVLDRSSGAERRRFAQWPEVYQTLIGQEQLLIHARDELGVQRIAAIGIRGAALRWQRSLPQDLELRDRLLPCADGLALVLDGAERGSALLAFGPAGDLQLAAPLAAGEQVLINGGTPLALSETGLRGLAPLAPPALAAVPAPRLSLAEGDLASSLPEQLERFSWQTVGPAAYALARSQEQLIVLVRPAEAEVFRLRLAPAGDDLDQDGLHLRILPAGQASLHGQQAGWVILDQARLSDAEGPLLALRLGPAGPATGSLRVRGECAGASDGADGPSWLLQLWRPVAR